MIKFIFCLLLPMFFYSSLAAQNTLHVLDKGTQQPVQDVYIVVKSTNQQWLTTRSGTVLLPEMADSVVIIVRHAAYAQKTLTYSELHEKNFTIYLSEKVYSFEEFVFSANKIPEKIEDIAQRIEVISAREIKALQPQTSADLLQSSANVFVQKSQMGGGSPVIRGMEANRVLLVVDGIRMNNAIYRSGHLQNAITLDPAIMDRVEVVYGPGSVIYGSDALGGVMHFFSRNPELSPGDSSIVDINSFVRYSSANDGQTMHLDGSVGFKKIAVLGSVTLNNFGHLRTGSNRNPFYNDFGKRDWFVGRIGGQDTVLANPFPNLQYPTAYRQADYFVKFLWAPTDSTSHLVNFQRSSTTNIPRYDRLTVLRNGLPRFAEWYYGPQERLLLSYTFENKNKLLLSDNQRLIVSYQDLQESRITRNFNDHVKNHRIEDVQVFGLTYDVQKLVKNKYELRYGAEAYYNNVQSSAFSMSIIDSIQEPLDTRYPAGGSYTYNAAVFLSNRIEIGDKWVFSQGVRYNYDVLHANLGDTSFFNFPFREINLQNSAVTGKLGAVFLPGKGWQLNAFLSTGFRSPNIDDAAKVFESVPGQVVVPNQNLKPEYAYNGEITVLKDFNDVLRAEINGYYMLLNNVLVRQGASFNGLDSIEYDGQMSRVTMLTNSDEGFITGFSAFLLARFNDQVSLSGKLTYTYGHNSTTGQPLSHIPPVFGKTSLQYKNDNFRSEFWVMYNGWKHLDEYGPGGEDNPEDATAFGMPAWYTLNARASYRFNRYLSADITLENILDQHYRVFASGLSAPGRNLVMGLHLNY